MPIHPRCAALPQDLHYLLGAFAIGSDQDELAIVRVASMKKDTGIEIDG